jgi:hypothetical protein
MLPFVIHSQRRLSSPNGTHVPGYGELRTSRSAGSGNTIPHYLTMHHAVLFVFCCIAAFAAAQQIQFAVSVSRGGATPGFAISNGGNMTYVFSFFEDTVCFLILIRYLNSCSEGFRAFERWYNASGRPAILADGVNYTLSLRIDTNNYTATSIRASYNKMLNTSSPVFFFSPFGTTQTQYAAEVTEPNNHLLVSSTASSSIWNTAYKLAFSTWPTFTSYAPHFSE